MVPLLQQYHQQQQQIQQQQQHELQQQQHELQQQQQQPVQQQPQQEEEEIEVFVPPKELDVPADMEAVSHPKIANQNYHVVLCLSYSLLQILCFSRFENSIK
jgi:hypothetical protein